ncbi:MAG: ABC transporter permease subunit [Dehalococcoidia bacterium]|nr:ABC transporter permease subunit [Dehalococcoidia bacterium]
MFSRLVHDARISLYVGVFATLAAMIPSVAMGIISAYSGGWVDYLWGRFVDTVQALPGLLLLIAIMVILWMSLVNVILALSFGRAIVGRRVMRSATLGVMNEVYIEASRAARASNARIMWRHILPNIFPTVIVVNTLAFGGVILAEASLSFLGYGVSPPSPSWGGMLAVDGRQYMFSAPWMLWAPTLVLALVVFGVNMFGDALRDVLDPPRGARERGHEYGQPTGGGKQMPLYEYVCDECDLLFEKIRPVRLAREAQPCPECDADARRMVPANFNPYIFRNGATRRLLDNGRFWHYGREVPRPVNTTVQQGDHPDLIDAVRGPEPLPTPRKSNAFMSCARRNVNPRSAAAAA